MRARGRIQLWVHTYTLGIKLISILQPTIVAHSNKIQIQAMRRVTRIRYQSKARQELRGLIKEEMDHRRLAERHRWGKQMAAHQLQANQHSTLSILKEEEGTI